MFSKAKQKLMDKIPQQVNTRFFSATYLATFLTFLLSTITLYLSLKFFQKPIVKNSQTVLIVAVILLIIDYILDKTIFQNNMNLSICGLVIFGLATGIIPTAIFYPMLPKMVFFYGIPFLVSLGMFISMMAFGNQFSFAKLTSCTGTIVTILTCLFTLNLGETMCTFYTLLAIIYSIATLLSGNSLENKSNGNAFAGALRLAIRYLIILIIAMIMLVIYAILHGGKNKHNDSFNGNGGNNFF